MSVQNAEIPVDQTHTAHNYFAHGGNELVIGGKLTFLSGATVEGGDGLFEGEGSAGFNVMPNQAASDATTIAALKDDFNELLNKLKNARLMEPDAVT
mgnify:FL=1